MHKIPTLIGAPYKPPVARRRTLFCRLRGDVRVLDWTAAPIPWPRCWSCGTGGTPSLIVADELVRALQTESSLAMQHYFGMSRKTVTRLRRKLGIDRWTPGTVEVWRQLWPKRLGVKGSRKGGAAFKRLRQARKAR